MQIDLGRLSEMHPRLPGDVALLMAVRAALGLQRNGHVSGITMSLDIERVLMGCLLAWPAADLSAGEQHDANRVTEDGAEAVALAVAHQDRGWRVIRRMQREEHADWLLEQPGGVRRHVVALEVSGVDHGSITSRLREKLEQVAKSVDVDQRWAGVVGFEKPIAALHSTRIQEHGR